LTRRLVYSAHAREDLVDIASYIAHESGSLSVARDFAKRIDERCRKLASLPGILGQARPEFGGLRSTPHGSYTIFFRYVEERLEIVDVLHSARDLETLFEVAPE
jgi:toxin ParE1/3/4